MRRLLARVARLSVAATALGAGLVFLGTSQAEAGTCVATTTKPLVTAIVPAAGGTYAVYMLYPQVADSNACLPISSPSTPSGYCLSWVDGPWDFLNVPGVGTVTVHTAVPNDDFAACMIDPL